MPRLDFWFRLFHHASLGLASVCLLYAEAFFLLGPLLLCLYLLAGLQVLAFGADGRRWLLPGWAANLLAGAVAGGGATWIGLEINSPDSVLADLPLPAGLLPYIGPILIALLVVKLFRPRTPRDFWLLQGVGALQVALACVLATNPESGLLFGVLLAAYVAFALGCLTLRHFQEEQSADTARAAERLPFTGRMAPLCLRWTLGVAALAAPLFLLTPRLNGPGWDSSSLALPGQRGALTPDQAGFFQTIDLNRDGQVHLSGDEVFRVSVVPADGDAAPELPAEQRWRGCVLDTYVHGHWYNSGTMTLPDLKHFRPPDPAPELRPGQYRLDFTVAAHAGGFFLAEPVRSSGDRGQSTRVDKIESSGKRNPQVVSTRGPVLPLLYNGPHAYSYRQTVVVGADPDRSTDEGDLFYLTHLLPTGEQRQLPGLADWTAALLRRLADNPVYGLKPADVRPSSSPDAAPPPPAGSMVGAASGPRPPALPSVGWERVGRALTLYLARSGDYAYTLDLRRQDPSLDPVMDFLLNVKMGHCERFASALALMLRSQNIPSRVVIGFRGAGDRTDDGAYVVRQNQAHAWVQMRVPAPPPPDPAKDRGKVPRWQWVMLDPTPASAPPDPEPYTLWQWWQDGQRTSQQWWGDGVVNYNAEQQANLWAGLQSPVVLAALAGGGLGLPALAALGVFAWAKWRGRPRARTTKAAAPASAGYARLAALLARHGGPHPAVGGTPREFAAQAHRFLLGLTTTAVFAELPDDIVDRLYRVRFGDRPLGNGEAADAEARLDELAAALRAAGK